MSLDFLYLEARKKYKTFICHRGLHFAVKKETDLIRTFFFAERYSLLPIHLPLLGMALQHRSVTVSTDEALCISTLLSLDLHAVLSVPAEDRMRVVWEKLAESKHGIPAAIIFFTGRRMDVAGFRWAPASLLSVSQEGIDPNERFNYLESLKAECLTHYGLQVRSKGFRIRPKSYHDGLPHDPWWGGLRDKNDGRPRRIAESFVHFRDRENNWFRVCKQETLNNGRVETSEE